MNGYMLLLIIFVIIIFIYTAIYLYIDNRRFNNQLVVIHIQRCINALKETKNCNDIDKIHDSITNSIMLLEFILENNKRKDENDDEKE